MPLQYSRPLGALRSASRPSPRLAPLALALLLRWPGLFAAAAVPALAVQVETLWLLTGGTLEPERFWVTAGALAWLVISRRDPLQVGLAGLVILHGLVGGTDVNRGGYGLVAAAALVSALLGSIIWQVGSKRS